MGLALDFATDLRCNKATYFDAKHGIDWKRRCYRGEPSQMLCCDAMRRKELYLCVACAGDMSACNICNAALCEDCTAHRPVCVSCDTAMAVCEDHRFGVLVGYGWAECDVCERHDCFNCTSHRVQSGVCNGCRGERREL